MPDRRNQPRTICPAFWHGDLVFLKTDRDGEPGMVTRLVILPNDTYVYTVSWGSTASDTAHYDFELTDTPQFVPAENDNA